MSTNCSYFNLNQKSINSLTRLSFERPKSREVKKGSYELTLFIGNLVAGTDYGHPMKA